MDDISVFRIRRMKMEMRTDLNGRLNSFLQNEIYKYNYESIINLLKWENVRSFFYEGNMYSIVKKADDLDNVIIANEVALEHGALRSQASVVMNIAELIELIEAAGKNSEI